MSEVQAPTLIEKKEPVYSDEALRAGLEGQVLLSISIGEDGVPGNITVVQPLGKGLDEKAKECVAQCRFHPAMKDGKPIRTDAKVEVNFKIVNQ